MAPRTCHTPHYTPAVGHVPSHAQAAFTSLGLLRLFTGLVSKFFRTLGQKSLGGGGVGALSGLAVFHPNPLSFAHIKLNDVSIYYLETNGEVRHCKSSLIPKQNYK